MPDTPPRRFVRPDEVLRHIGLKAEQTFVHLGSGAGFWLIPAAKIVGTSGKVYGIDIRPEMLAEVENKAAREHLDNTVHTVRGDLEHDRGSRLDDNLADLVLIANVLYQADPVKLITEAARLAKPAGRVVIVAWDVKATPLGPPPAKRIPEPELRQLAESLGLDFIESFNASPYHYGLIFA